MRFCRRSVIDEHLQVKLCFMLLPQIDKEVVCNWVLSLQAHPKSESILETGSVIITPFISEYLNLFAQLRLGLRGCCILQDNFMASMVPEAPSSNQMIKGYVCQRVVYVLIFVCEWSILCCVLCSSI